MGSLIAVKFHPIEYNTSRNIREHHLNGLPIVAMVSGGPDSMALALVLKTLCGGGPFNAPFHLSVFHVNHCVRGEESLKDEEFVNSFCTSNKINLFSEHFNLKNLNIKNKNFQQCARKWRYQRAFELSMTGGIIATGHHQQDNVESILMHIIRGSGPNGIKGLKIFSSQLFRPFLEYSKNDILSYLKKRNQNYRIDESNYSKKYTRNRVRLELMPLLQSFNPQFSKALLRLSHSLSEPAQFTLESKNWNLSGLRQYLIQLDPQVIDVLSYNSLSNLKHHLSIWENDKHIQKKLHLGGGWYALFSNGQLSLKYFSLCQKKLTKLQEVFTCRVHKSQNADNIF